MPDAAHSPARLLAPVALVVCAIAFFAVLLGSDAEDDGSSGASAPVAETETQQEHHHHRAPAAAAAQLHVKTGDTLGAIAEKTGVEVEELQEPEPGARPAGARGRSEDQAAGVTTGGSRAVAVLAGRLRGRAGRRARGPRPGAAGPVERRRRRS